MAQPSPPSPPSPPSATAAPHSPAAAPVSPTLSPENQATVREVLCACAGLEGPLLPVLHGVQEALGCVPPGAIPLIAEALNLSRAEVHGVVTYYHHFRQQAPAAPVLQVCRAESCQAMGGEALFEQARNDARCSTEAVYCLGLCAMSPAVMLQGRPHARMTAQKLESLLAQAGSDR